MHDFHDVQEAFRRGAFVDLDGDGRGEYGTLRELSATDGLRGHPENARLEPRLLGPSFHRPGGNGTVDRVGYRFQLYLPTKDGGWVCADRNHLPVDPDGAEERWVAYAWPVFRTETRTRTFRADQTGTVWSTTFTEHPSVLPQAEHLAWTIVR